jgi:hypothetical protein
MVFGLWLLDFGLWSCKNQEQRPKTQGQSPKTERFDPMRTVEGLVLITFGSHRATHKLPRGGSAIKSKTLDTVGQSQKLQSTNTEPV